MVTASLSRPRKEEGEETSGCHGIADGTQAGTEKSKENWTKQTSIKAYQQMAEKIYLNLKVQIAVAFLIGANFITNIIEKQIDPAGDRYASLFEAFELGYNILFTIELAVNMFAFWCSRFWNSRWNIFDFVVVSIGIINTARIPLPPSFQMLRMMRAFRVFRLFKRVDSLNKIIVALVRAIPGVVHAFVILTIVMSIYAILAVELFRTAGFDTNGQCRVASSRGTCVGDEYFGNFGRALYTLFQVMTGDSWSEAVARPILENFSSWVLGLGTAIFFVSFMLLNTIVFINVVVAVLLDKFLDDKGCPPPAPLDPELNHLEGLLPDSDDPTLVKRNHDGVSELLIPCEDGSDHSNSQKIQPAEAPKSHTAEPAVAGPLCNSSTCPPDDAASLRTHLAAIEQRLEFINEDVRASRSEMSALRDQLAVVLKAIQPLASLDSQVMASKI